MIAYNKTWLDNILIRADVASAFEKNLISETDKIIIENENPVGFYSPNYFTRVGLFILTYIIISLTVGLIAILNMDNHNNYGILFIFLSILTYIILELIIRYKNHYRSGVDDALIWLSGIGFITGINLLMEQTLLVDVFIVFLMALYFFFRFANALMAIISTITFLQLTFLLSIKMGPFFIATFHFILLLLSIGIYFSIKRFLTSDRLKYYKEGVQLIEITALICIYLSVNYYAVTERRIEFLNYYFDAPTNTKFTWFYWLFTIIIPLLYIFKGIQNKDRILLRVGMILVPATIFTIRYYHAIIPVEIALTIGGILLIAMAYALIKYLHQPKNGFTYESIAEGNALDKFNVEGLIISKSFNGVQNAGQPSADDGRAFGGGNFGGGGASGDF